MFRAGIFRLTTMLLPSTILVMVRAPFGAWVHGRITSQRQGLKDRYGEILDRTMFVMVQLLSSDDIWVDTYVPCAARQNAIVERNALGWHSFPLQPYLCTQAACDRREKGIGQLAKGR